MSAEEILKPLHQLTSRKSNSNTTKMMRIRKIRTSKRASKWLRRKRARR